MSSSWCDPAPTGLRAAIIGQGALPLQCAERLVQAGLQLVRVLTDDAQFHAWAEQRGVDCSSPAVGIDAALRQHRPDVLFSIVNPHRIPSAATGLCEWGAVNFHDSLLPALAGTNAASWALITGARSHGVTWHLVSDRIDAGDVLLQREFALQPDDTALRVNLRCHQAALDSFGELLQRWALGQLRPSAQNPAGRSFFARTRRPPGGGVLNWQRPAADLHALVRALHFGPAVNALGSAWLRTDREWLRVERSELAPHTAGARPGTVLSLDEHSATLATPQGSLRLLAVTDACGQARAFAQTSLKPGQCIACEGPEEEHEQQLAATVQHEASRVAQLAEWNCALLPWSQPCSPEENLHWQSYPVAPVGPFCDRFLLATSLAFWTRVCGPVFDAWLPASSAAPLAPVVPVRIQVDTGASAATVIQRILQQIDASLRQGPMALDLMARYPALRGRTLPPPAPDGERLWAQLGPHGELVLGRVWRCQSAGLCADDHLVLQQLHQAYASFLSALLHCPAQPLDQLPVVAPGRDELPVLPELSLKQAFEAQVQLSPDAPALLFGAERQSYEELNQAGNRLARALQLQGVDAHDRVAVCMPRSLELVVTLVALSKLGAACVALDPEYPAARLAWMLEDSQPRLLVACSDLQVGFPDAVPRFWLDTANLAEFDANDLSTAVHPESCASLFYTSGSSGVPKGVCVLQRSVVQLVSSLGSVDFGPAETLLQLASVSFDASTFEVWGPLLTGSRLAILPPGLPSLSELVDFIERFQVTTAFFTTSLLHALVDGPLLQRALPLRQVVAGGEALSLPHARRVADWLGPSGRMVNGYGPTECTTFAACYRLLPGVEPGPRVPIGRPVAGNRIHVLDAQNRAVPVGVAGELFLGGTSLASGYWRRPELTEERFTEPPGSGLGRLYRTGDRVRMRGDGNLDFLGRIDHQLKIRGHRVEPEEIESVLREHPGVLDALVVAREDGAGKRLVCWFVADAEVGTAALRSYLEQRLPGYMVPSEFARVSDLPLTANGKKDRSTLSRTEPLPCNASPLSRLWSEALGGSPADNFFEAGGDSLAAMRLLASVETVLGKTIGLAHFWNNPTRAELSRRVEQTPAEACTRPAPKTLSRQQRQLWLTDQNGQGAAYVVPLCLRFQGTLDLPALHTALDRLVARHDALRQSFHRVGSSVQSRTAETVSVTWLETRAEELWLQAGLPLDLTRPPMVRACSCEEAQDRWLVALAFHHIAFDGASVKVVLRELAGFYNEVVQGLPVSLSPPVGYADYAREQPDPDREQLLACVRRLAGAPPLSTLLPDFPRQATSSSNAATLRFETSPALTEALRRQAGVQKTSLFTTLLAGFAAVMSRCTGQLDLLLGSPAAGRSAGLEGTVGCFVNLLLLRCDLTHNPSFAELCRRMQDSLSQALDTQEVPFDLLLERLAPVRLPGCAPLVQVAMALQEGFAVKTPFVGLQCEAELLDPTEAKFDLLLELRPRGDRLQGVVTYAASLYLPDTIRRLVQQWIALLEQAVASPELPLDLCSAAEVPIVVPAAPAEEKCSDPRQHRLERQLLLLWEQCLEIHPVGLEHNFFDLGGHSLLALQLVARIEAELGLCLPLATLLAHPTVAGLAEVLRQESSATGTIQVLRAGSPERAPLFFWHGDLVAGGLYCEALARGLDAQQGFALVHPNTEPLADTRRWYAEMVDADVASLLQCRPQGPYLLGGYCAGGLVAVEVAGRLQALGHRVALVLLIEALPGRLPTSFRSRSRRLLQMLRSGPGSLARLKRLPRVCVADVVHRYRTLKLRWAAGPSQAPTVQLNYRRAWEAYKPGRIGSERLVVLRAADEQRDWLDPSLGWKYYAPDVECVSIPGCHEGCVRRYPEALAAELNRILAGVKL